MGRRPKDINAALRVNQAIKLRAQKMPYEEIAHVCGFANRGVAYNAIHRELEKRMAQDVEELRREELSTLDELQQTCFKRLDDPEFEKAQLFAVDRLLAIAERRAKLMGLDQVAGTNIAAAQVVIREVPPGYLGVDTE